MVRIMQDSVSKTSILELQSPVSLAILPLQAGKTAAKARLPILDSLILGSRRRRTDQKATRTRRGLKITLVEGFVFA